MKTTAVVRIRTFTSGEFGRGIGGTGLSFLITLFTQVASVPLFLTSVGTEAYAAWIVLATVPSFISLLDLGFAGAAATKASSHAVSGGGQQANKVLCGAWVWVSLLSVTVLIVAFLGIYLFIPASALPALGSDPRMVLGLLCAWAVIGLQNGYPEAAFRVEGTYATGIIAYSLLRLSEFLILAGALLFTKNLLVLAWTMLLGRIIFSAIAFGFARRRVRWFRLSIRTARGARTSQLLRPGLGYLVLTVSSAVVIQGQTLALNASVNADELVAFTTVRTMMGIITQFVLVATLGALPALTRAVAQRDRALIASIEKRCAQATVAAATAGVVAALLLGPVALNVWTANRVQVSYGFLCLMIATTAADAIFQPNLNLLRATNMHFKASIFFLASSITSVAICLLTAPHFGLVAAPVSLFWIDIVMIPVCARLAGRLRASFDSIHDRRSMDT